MITSRKRLPRRNATPRIGAVSYLNSKPLIEGLSERLSVGTLALDYPSRLADQLKTGQLDVALIPSIEYFRGDTYSILSDACVAARGPVLSVKLYARVPFGEIKTLALDEGSRTSVMLAQVMLFERYGVLPAKMPFLMQQSTRETSADAILMIGDRAMFEPNEQFHDVWDLGDEWFRWTGLPFVFAMWVARNEADFDESSLSRVLSSARDLGVSRISSIAQRESPGLKLPIPKIETYLGQHLHFTLGSAERHGLELFRELVVNLEAHILAATLQIAPTLEVRRYDYPDQHTDRFAVATSR